MVTLLGVPLILIHYDVIKIFFKYTCVRHSQLATQKKKIIIIVIINSNKIWDVGT